ncbi:bi-domain-containing oxidoreductase [Flammeovirga kamogawensis]|uniref:Bi-domain-containing oxidoreductase n=1 Tax=Flammeovirga kamogawensis TaxID=373891 RepID=A0ABX8GZF0_9BACT|nr:bi-domain-containing oxidoreductase [Flammeovirga kamogawensis]MBB6458901.1 putative dehydrogenase/threonine dehydrogenase-like Zn-dependent dehydrogenase [Flammeovirga kamogawensis]QWG08482.1 bi-domain-containing oxidoreductase [Flammeovirga kamogawensis]TRX66777.1 zinc-binding dehydrogenase [Flammeovirga kamogawensis]
MKQIIQDLKNGQTILEEVPAPQVKSGCVLIQTTRTLVSLGTERMLVEFGKASYIEKARQQPDKVKMVLDKMKTDGVMPTVEAVFNKLNQPLPLGYCNVGKVVAVGKGVSTFKVGDRVASNGNHAEFVNVPENLVASIPDNVTDEEAAFTVIGSIGLQGIRLLNPTFGETIVVVGLGLIGLVTAELLRANGCIVIGFDFDPQKVEMAKSKGINAINPAEGTDQVKYVLEQTNNIGADGVIITASAKGNEIISQSANMSRKRGRIILVGVIGLDISRADFYEKELTFQVSCSYGAGRYDEDYEQKGNDYPIGYVRWTEKRNFEAILQAISSKQLQVTPLITERVSLNNYEEIYGDMKKAGSIASILEFPENSQRTNVVTITPNNFNNAKGVYGIVGAGNYTSSMIIPRLKEVNAHLKYIASAGGLSSAILAKKGGITNATTDYQEILNDKEVDTVIITTRHDLHAGMVMKGLQANKNVFVEKPLCLNTQELEEIITTYKESKGTLTVGFNRRFAPLATKMKSLVGNGPKNIVATMNAGAIPPEVWVHDMEVGGGRILGEACHYVDLCSYLAGSNVTEVCMNSMGTNPSDNTDNVSILLKYENGTNAVINYFANGSKAYSKERVEVFTQERTLIMDNWRTLKGYGFKGFSTAKTAQDKGQKVQFKLLNERIQTGGEPIVPFDSIINTTKASIAAIDSLKEGKWIKID